MDNINCESKRLVTEEENSIELDWLEMHLFRQCEGVSVKVHESDSTFNPMIYRGQRCLDRVDQVRSGTARTMNRLEYAAACGKQQILELLFCLYAKYGNEYPCHVLFEIGVSSSRLTYSDYGYFYGEWIQCAAERDFANAEQSKMLELQKLMIEQQARVADAARSRAILESYRAVSDRVIIPPPQKWTPNKSVFLPTKSGTNLVPNMVLVGMPCSDGFDSEGISLRDVAGIVTEFTEPKLREYAMSMGAEAQKQRLMFEHVLQDKVNSLVLEFERKNDIVLIPDHKKGIEEWNLSSDQYCDLKTKVLSNEIRNPEPVDYDDKNQRRVLELVITEHENEVERRDRKWFPKPFTATAFKFPWDLHVFGPLVEQNVAMTAVWHEDKLGQVERIIVSNFKGVMMMDLPINQGVEYSQSLFQARRAAFLSMYGCNVFAINIYQKMARIGITGDPDRMIDVLEIPMLKGKKAALTVEKYQLRYGREPEAIINRKDSVLDNLMFCVFMMRRDGINWKHRRRRKY